MEGLVRSDAANYIAKARGNPFNSYKNELKVLNGASDGFSKYGKRLGIAGVALTGLNLGTKYFNEGITKKDVFDGIVSVGLALITITNPIGLIGLGLYAIADGTGLLDGFKSWIGANDDIIAKYGE